MNRGGMGGILGYREVRETEWGGFIHPSVYRYISNTQLDKTGYYDSKYALYFRM